MYLPSHISAGTLIGLATQNPIFAGAAAFVSHFVLDAIPHWQLVRYPYRFSWKSTVTLVGTIVITPLFGWYWYTSAPEGHQASVLVAMICSCVPDLDDLSAVISWTNSSKVFRRFRRFHNNLQAETTQMYGVMFQLIPIAVAMAALSL